MVSLRILPFALRPRSHFFLTFFRWLEANRAERESGQARAFWARRASGRSEAQRLDPAPALGTLFSEKMGTAAALDALRRGPHLDHCARLNASQRLRAGREVRI